ncbi:P-loop containing nucleoside triphosphate hydrolase protein [Lyophyllum atratum]|nr:P-loop containing nucleoside triphosphate hydrolase protein [Lyophyllum atratum]
MSNKNKSTTHIAATAKDVAVRDGTARDIVIPVMGPSGAGKSTFINAVLGADRMPVGHKLTSCTSQLEYAVIESVESPYPALKGCRVIIVDTPGFDDTYEGDAEILQRIATWLEESYLQKAVLGGVIYLHDISHDRFSGTARRNLDIFNHLCGDAALCKVVLGTTKWGRVPAEGGNMREAELRNVYWKSMIDKGSQVRRFQGSKESALEFINVVLHNKVKYRILEMQKELAVDRKIVPETKAGKELRYTLQQVLDMQKQMVSFEEALAQGGDPEARAKFDDARRKTLRLMQDIKALKFPFGW